MNPLPAWLPPFIELHDCDGIWQSYEDAVYAKFCEDFVTHKVLFRGKRVAIRKHPPTHGKEYGFWHCVQEGAIEDERTPDIDRCRRIAWIRTVVEHADDPDVQCWSESRGGKVDHLLWVAQTYVVVLSERGTTADGGPEAYLLKTAFCTLHDRQKRKKRAAMELAKKANAAPKSGV